MEGASINVSKMFIHDDNCYTVTVGSGMEDNKQDQVDGNLSEDKSSMPSSKQEVFCFPAYAWFIEDMIKKLYFGRIFHSFIYFFVYTYM